MSDKKIISIFKKYQKVPLKSKLRRGYFNAFEKKMFYRTTKTENPSTTMRMVNKVLKKLAVKSR